MAAEPLYWDGPYAIARCLMILHPEVDPSEVTLNMVYNWVVSLPDFQDDPQLADDDLLAAILQEWFEEVQSR